MEAAALHLDLVERGEGDVVAARRVGARRAQHVGQGDAGPGGVADGAGLPRVARHRLHRVHLGAAVAGALQGGVDGALREAPEVGQAQAQRRGDEAADLQHEGLGLDLRHVAVAADVELGRRRLVALAQRGELRLGVVGRLRVDDFALVGHGVAPG